MALGVGLGRVLLVVGAGALLAAADADGWQQYAAGDYVGAVASWTADAAQGDVHSLFGLGLAYDLGKGVAPDAARACQYYQQAGEAGVTAAAFDFAIMLDGGRCGGRQAAKAADWYARAAAAGYPRAEYDLAQLYETGDGVPRNLTEAAEWYRLAADAGLAAARERAVTLAAEGRKSAAGAVLVAAAPVSPAGGPLPDRGMEVPFVWAAPAQPGLVKYFLEVDSLGPDAATEVANKFADVSATQVVLPPGAAHYAWRVITVAPATHSYVASPWQRFAIGARGAR